MRAWSGKARKSCWLRDESLEDSENLPEPQVLAEEIATDLEAALDEIRGVLEDLQQTNASVGESS